MISIVLREWDLLRIEKIQSHYETFGAVRITSSANMPCLSQFYPNILTEIRDEKEEKWYHCTLVHIKVEQLLRRDKAIPLTAMKPHRSNENFHPSELHHLTLPRQKFVSQLCHQIIHMPRHNLVRQILHNLVRLRLHHLVRLL